MDDPQLPTQVLRPLMGFNYAIISVHPVKCDSRAQAWGFNGVNLRIEFILIFQPPIRNL